MKHLLLGFMHNWLEGILQHQLRVLWGVGTPEKIIDGQQDTEMEDTTLERYTDSDVSESASKLEDLAEEAAEYAAMEAVHNPSTPLPPTSPSPSPSADSNTSSNQTATPQINANSFLPGDADPLDAFEDEDFIPEVSQFKFSDNQLLQIWSCITSVTIPTWVQRPPSNLGEKSHGKLKAHEYLTLFTVILPLVLAEIWHGNDPSELKQQHFLLLVHLVSATNIISSFKTSNVEADLYSQHYAQYWLYIQTLFPSVREKPNHHYATHNADMLKYWGPVAAISEFPGERTNGDLQQVKTNRRLCK